MKSKLFLAGLLSVAFCVTPAAADQRTDAVLIVNSTSPSYADAQHYIQPYLDQFGVPYTVLDIAVSPVASTIGDYALIIVGHKQLDLGNVYLSPAEQTNITTAVQNGSGLVNFENDLSPDASTPRYQYVQDLFDFDYVARQSGENVLLSATAPSHYITSRFVGGQEIGTNPMLAAGIDIPASVTNLARFETLAEPILMSTTHGSGRAVQWGSYEWMKNSVKGPVHEFDGLMWRSLVWAARKPFVLQGLPNFVTMRVDDVHGGFWWMDTANAHGLKPWLGLFYKDILESDAQKLASKVNGGLATASVHAKGASGGSAGEFFFFDHYLGVPLPDGVVNANFDDATAWHTQHGIPISKYVLGHWYEIGNNVFTRLQQWGVQFIGTQMQPGQPYVGSPWLQLGPYRLFETGIADQFATTTPVYYADFLPIPGHPELDNNFFNCVTEIRDDASYEWYPDNDVAGTIGRGTRQTRQALDSMFLATLFTHEYFVQSITPANWTAEVQGITEDLKSYDPRYVTLDYACQYVRAMKTSNIATSTYNPATRVLTTNLSGNTDLATQFHAFVETQGEIGPVLVDVPAFAGSTQVLKTLPSTLNYIVVTPGLGTVPPGKTQQFVAKGYDAGGLEIPALTFIWGATVGGTIDSAGLFTAGGTTGVFTNAISATSGSVTGLATAEVYAPVLQGFDFATISGTLYAGSAFPITVEARDQHARRLDTYAGQAQLQVSTSTIAPSTTGSFNAGVWTGTVTISTASAAVTMTANDGGSNGTSNAFGLLAPRSGEIVIDCWDDDSQQPYLPTTTNDAELIANDGKWTEFWYQCPCRNYPSVFAASGEVANGLPVMRFHASGIVNATYEVRAKLYTGTAGRNMRYFYGFSAGTPTALFKDTVGGAGGAEGHAEYVLGTIVVTDGTFDLYVQDAQLLSGSDPFFGWASIRLVQLAGSLDHIVISPNPGQAPLGGTTAFTAQGYDALNVPINGLIYQWSASAGGTINQSGVFTSGGQSGTFTNAVSAESAGVTGYASVNVYAPVLDHFDLATIPSPGYAGTSFPLQVTARDQHGNVLVGYSGPAGLSDTTGTIVPTTTGSFVAGIWNGTVTIGQAGTGVTITVSSGPATGTSNAFNLLAPRSGTITFNCWEDAHQAPVLATTTNAGLLIPNDGVWTEFLYPVRGYPGVFAASGEATFGLPVMRFHDLGIQNGTYDVYGKLYTNDPGRNMRYYFGYTPGAPKASFVDTVGGTGGAEQFAEYLLGSVNITTGHFDIYVQDADLLSGGYPFFGWATIRLVSNCAATTWYRDLDVDSYGDPGTTLQSCTQPSGYVASAGDCNDNNAAVHPGVSDANCNGVDENCSGLADEGYVSEPTACGVGACASTGVTSCVAGVVQNSCVAGTPAPLDTTCNSIDDNCNGSTDEGYAPVPTACGVGACASTGVTSCVAGVVQNSCVAGTPAPSDTNCNNVDDNCNGSTDEGYAPVPTACGVGACASTGVTSCVAGAVQNSCVAGTPAPSDTNCNNVDDNCNGSTDEGYAPVPTACGVGACASTGVTSCVAGAVQNSCVAGTPAPSDTTCNSIDDNCNGLTDEGYAPSPTNCGVGACASTGVTSCVAGAVQNSCVAGTPAPSDTNCNNVDDNCNGSTDEGYAPVPTACGVGACASTGVTSCVAGVVQNSCVAGTPAPSDTTCNNVDDNCNGSTDEGYAPVPTACGVGACASTGVTSCVAGAVQNSCVAGTPAPSDTTCNNVDDNCNGSTDEGYAPVPTACGVGACASTGVTSCVAGVVQNSCVAGTPAPSDTTCNNVDDNCNGSTDEGYAPVPTACGVGACASTGVTSCVAGVVQNSCVAGTPAPSDTTCNNVDDNCNGSTDEGYAPVPTACGVGACASTGVTSCVAGAVQNSCVAGTPAPSDTTCNNVDDNCNGSTDEGYAPVPTACGVGACASTGVTSCVAGAVQNSCIAGTPAPSDTTCNNVDDNCNGSTDEGYAPVPTACGVGACASTGVTSCVAGAVQNSCVAGTPAPSDTTCNNVDDNCNGSTDEGYAPVPTACGVGACASTGVTSCVAGAVQNSCVAGTPAPSDTTCNNIDDNCNGSTDEGYAPVPTACGVGACASTGVTSCVAGAVQNSCVAGTPAPSDTTCNNIDDNCNGSTDEGYAPVPTACGVGACARTGVTSCVSGAVQNSCVPGAPTAEVCDGADNNCDGNVDNNVGPIWFRDVDGDGHGISTLTLQACTQPVGYVATTGDCNDADAGAFAIPVEVISLTVTPKPTAMQLDWTSQATSAGSATAYHVVASTNAFTSFTCLDNNVTTNRYHDRRDLSGMPAVYYLVRAKNSCGTATFGNGTAAPDRRDVVDATACP